MGVEASAPHLTCLRAFAGISFYRFPSQDLHVWIGVRKRHGVLEMYRVEAERMSDDEVRIVVKFDNEIIMTANTQKGGLRGAGMIGLAMLSEALKPYSNGVEEVSPEEVADVA